MKQAKLLGYVSLKTCLIENIVISLYKVIKCHMMIYRNL